MDVYIYCADIYCEECGREIRERITKEGNAPADHDDERSYDSDEFPKGPYPDGGGESDCPQHCGSGADCVNAYTPDGWNCKVGAFLENDLTADGVEYVVNEWLEKPDNPVVREWVKYYSRTGYTLETEVNGIKVSIG